MTNSQPNQNKTHVISPIMALAMAFDGMLLKPITSAALSAFFNGEVAF